MWFQVCPVRGSATRASSRPVSSGYPPADLLVCSQRDFGVSLVTPLLADQSAQAKAGAGYDRTAFAIDFDNQRATCPQGKSSTSWNPCSQHGAVSEARRKRGR